MPFTGLPLEEETYHATYRKEFHDYYGEGADAAALYKVQPIWIRFAPVFPRTAFLLDSLWEIYTAIGNALLDFNSTLMKFDPEDDWQKIGLPLESWADAFAFFSDTNMEAAERLCLLQVRWALHRSRGSRLDYLLKECARNLLSAARTEDRKLIREELLSANGEIPAAIESCRPGKQSGFLGVRKRIVAREEMLGDALGRIKEALESSDVPRQSVHIVDSKDHAEMDADAFAYQYGNGSVPEVRPAGRVTRFSGSPPRSRSPPWHADRGRHFAPRLRSISRESTRSSVYPGSSVTTWAPEAPEDRFSVSVRVFSAASGGWVESIANYDTGCDAGNFVSSSFVEDHLGMGHAIEEDPDADSTRIIDIGGNTTFRPRGRIKLTWVGRNLHKGRKGKRSEEFTGYFHVAPRPPADHSAEPFQILLGKDFIDENEVFTYRGFRLFRVKKHNGQEDPIELERRERLRREMEDERRIDRQASDAASIMTGTSGSFSSPAGVNNSPRSSSQSIPMSSAGAMNGLGVDAQAVA